MKLKRFWIFQLVFNSLVIWWYVVADRPDMAAIQAVIFIAVLAIMGFWEWRNRS